MASRARSSTPEVSSSSKRFKFDSEEPEADQLPAKNGDGSISPPDSEGFEDHCSICLHQVVDRTILPICSHEFCFDCVLIWCDQSRKCPLCNQDIGDHLLHHIRSKYDYQKHYLLPLRSSSPKPLQAQTAAISNRRARRPPRERAWGRKEQQEWVEADRLERAIEKRRWIYAHDLYAKHVASNAFTRYKSYPTPVQFSASQELISRTTMFLRRELRVWVNLDVEFLTTFIISIMKSIDIRSESAVKLLAEFLDMDTPYLPGSRFHNAEHFAHEVYSYVRSPYKDLFIYDTVVQYDVPDDVPSPSNPESNTFWNASSSRDHHNSSSSHPVSPPPSPGPSERHSSPSESLRLPDEQRGRRYFRAYTHRPSSSSQRETSWSPSGRHYSIERPHGQGTRYHVRNEDYHRYQGRNARGHSWGQCYEDDLQSPAAVFSMGKGDKGKAKAKQFEKFEEEIVPRWEENSRDVIIAADHGGMEYHTNADPVPTIAANSESSKLAFNPRGSQHQDQEVKLGGRRHPRTRSLLQSIQDHLGTTSGPHRPNANATAGPSNELVTPAPAAFPSHEPQSHSDGRPSLLMRLGNPVGHNIPANSRTIIEGPDGGRKADDWNDALIKPLSVSGVSSPETLEAKTHGQIARQEKERVSGIFTQLSNQYPGISKLSHLDSDDTQSRVPSNSLDRSIVTDVQPNQRFDRCAASFELEPQGQQINSQASASGLPTASAAFGTSTADTSSAEIPSRSRATLLRRLVKEKQEARTARQHHTTISETLTPTYSQDPIVDDESEGASCCRKELHETGANAPLNADAVVGPSQDNKDGSVLDADLLAIEARLKSRARLQARLATAKRSMG